MQAHIQQSRIQQSHKLQSTKNSSAQAIERPSKIKQFACVLFAVLLAFFLLPANALQPSHAYAAEVGTQAEAATAAEGIATAGSAAAKAGAEAAGTQAEHEATASTAGSKADAAATQPSTSTEAAAGATTEGAAATQPNAGAAADTSASTNSAAASAQPATSGVDAATAGVDAAAAQPAAETAAVTDAETGIATQSDIGVGVNVQGNILISGAPGSKPGTSYTEYDPTFDRGTNKVIIDRSTFGGLAYATLVFQPSGEADQEAAIEAWNQLPASEKYTLETMRVSTEEENIVRVLPGSFASEGDSDPENARVTLAFEGLSVGETTVFIDYIFTDPNTSATYQAHLSFPVYVQDEANAPTQIAVPSTSVTTWLDDTLNPVPSGGRSVYYYQYDGSNFDNKTQEFIISVSTGNENPATYSFDDMFDISIANTNDISSVYNTERFDSESGLVNGPDAHTYSLIFQAVSAGTTDVTFKLKQDPTKSVTVAVTVRTDHPEVNVSDFDMTMGASQRIYVDDNASASDASPITVPLKARQLSWQASKAKPFVTNITSSNEGVLAVQRISSPSWYVELAPFELVPVSAGTANLTLTDCYGKTYTCAVTVKPDGTGDTSVTVNSVTLVRDDDRSSVSKGVITMNVSDTEGVKLAADIDANGEVATRWTSSNPAIAEVVTTVNANGEEVCQVKPVRASYDESTNTTADCRITATVNGQVSDYCNIMVEPLEDQCTADASSPLGAASVTVSKAMPADVLQELQSVQLAISTIAPGSLPKVDAATADLEKNGAKLAGIYDIHFVNKSDGSIHTWNKPSHPITVKIPMTDAMKELHKFGTLSFYHVDSTTGERTKMPTWVDASQQFVCFETTHFSPFVLAAEPEAQDEGDGDGSNGDNSQTTKPDDKAGADNANNKTDGKDSGDSKDDGDADGDGAGTTLPKTADDSSALLVVALMAAVAALLLLAAAAASRREVASCCEVASHSHIRMKSHLPLRFHRGFALTTFGKTYGQHT